MVATNASWGIDFLMPEDAPIWCAMYDTLGNHGILNCAAVTNEDVNVDEVGDLPTTCPSDFLIAVTNVDHNDEKVEAGFGATSVDMGAFVKLFYRPPWAMIMTRLVEHQQQLRMLQALLVYYMHYLVRPL